MEKIKDIIPDYIDGDFLCPNSGAKLASLFGLDQAESQGNESFQFTAPKQPKKTCPVLGAPPQKPAPPPSAPAVLFATAVHAFCFVNGQHVKQGKIGAAVLGSHATKEYKILLYGNKQKQITTARIHRGFVLTVQACNYVTFYDDQQQNWSLMFDSEKARPEFCKQICVCRWNSAASADSLLTQDLDQGEGQAVDAGDTVEMAYSGWLLQNHSIGQKFDSNVGKEKLQRLRLGAGKALKGWENGMLGMRKGGRRLLIVPPSVGYGSKIVPNHVPANSTLVFDVEIHRVKFCKDRRSGGSADVFSSSPGICSDTLSEENSQVDTTETYQTRDQAPNWKVESINEGQTMSDASKAKLISRIAKMGQPMLPFLTGAIPAQPDPSDSDTEDVSESGAVRDPFPSHSPSAKPSQMPCTSPTLLNQPDEAHKQEAVPPQTDSNTAHGFQPYSFSQNPNSPSQLNSFTSVYPSQHISYITPDITSFLMSDARQHSQEILLAIEKLGNRVDQLTYKVNELQKEGHMSFGLSSVSLETNMILHNIQRIIQESLCLKNEVLQKSSQVEEQNRKICELTELNKRMEQQYNQTKQLQTEQEKANVCSELSSSCLLVNLQQRATEIQAVNDKQKHCAQISLLEARVEELVKQREQSEQCWRAEKKKCKEMEAIIQNMDEELQDLRAEKENLDQVLSDRKRKWQAERERFVQEQEEEYQRSQKEIWQLLIQLRRARDATQPLVQQTEFELSWQKKRDAAMAEQKEPEGTNTDLQKQVKRVMNEVFESLRTELDLQESYSGHMVLHIVQNTIKNITMKLLSKPWELESNVDEDKAEEEYLSTEEDFSNGNMQKEKCQIEEKVQH